MSRGRRRDAARSAGSVGFVVVVGAVVGGVVVLVAFGGAVGRFGSSSSGRSGSGGSTAESSGGSTLVSLTETTVAGAAVVVVATESVVGTVGDVLGGVIVGIVDADRGLTVVAAAVTSTSSAFATRRASRVPAMRCR